MFSGWFSPMSERRPITNCWLPGISISRYMTRDEIRCLWQPVMSFTASTMPSLATSEVWLYDTVSSAGAVLSIIVSTRSVLNFVRYLYRSMKYDIIKNLSTYSHIWGIIYRYLLLLAHATTLPLLSVWLGAKPSYLLLLRKIKSEHTVDLKIWHVYWWIVYYLQIIPANF